MCIISKHLHSLKIARYFTKTQYFIPDDIQNYF